MKFEIGNRVKYIGKSMPHCVGQEGDIIEIDDEASEPYKIRFNDGLYWCREESLELATPIKECTCNMTTLMSTGCQCGNVAKYRIKW
jgi:hypothetical protein